MAADPVLQALLDRQAKQVASFRRLRARRRPRHPALVTADRLADHMDRWPDAFDGDDRDEVAHVRYLLEQIAEGGSK